MVAQIGRYLINISSIYQKDLLGKLYLIVDYHSSFVYKCKGSIIFLFVIQSEAKNLDNTKKNSQVDAHEILPPYGRLDDKKGMVAR